MKHSVREVELKNGAKGLLIDVPGAPVTEIYSTFNAGHSFSPKGKQELAHVAEHLMFANKKYPSKKEFVIEVEKNGAYRNAFTSDKLMGYDYQCANFELERILKLHALQVTQPVFKQADLVTESSNVREELNEYLSDNQRYAGEILTSKLLSIDGLEERLNGLPSISIADVKKHYLATHTARNMRFVIAGGITDSGVDVEDVLNNELKQLPVGERMEVPLSTYQKLEQTLSVKRPISQIYYYIITGQNSALSYEEEVSARLVDRVLNSGYRSRIYSQARERGLAYHVSSFATRDLYNSEYYIGGFTTKKNIKELFMLIKKELTSVLSGDINQAEFDDAKRLAKGNYARAFQTAANLANWYSSYTWEDTIIDFNEYPGLVENITIKQATEAFAKLFQDNKWGISFVGDIDDGLATQLTGLMSDVWK